MSMSEWAKHEVEIACKRENPDRKEGEWDYGCSCYESALKAYLSLMEDGHSGMSFGFTRNILIRLLYEKPLTPIEDVWEFLNDVVKVPHCRLYDEGCKRIGCIGCPMANQEKEFARYPKYKDLYIHAFDRMLKIRAEKNLETGWKTAQEVFDWWIS